jgi:hypothetical protein
MARTGLFTRRYDVNPEMLLDFLEVVLKDCAGGEGNCRGPGGVMA